MTKNEFEALANYEVSWEDYRNIIEPMYMATDLSKEEFVKCIDKKRFALKTQRQLIAEAKKEAYHLYAICGIGSDLESEQRYRHVIRQLEERFGGEWITNYGYELFPGRGSRYPKEIIVYHYGTEYRTIKLVA